MSKPKLQAVTIELPVKLLTKLEPILRERELNLDEVVRLYLRSLTSVAAASKALEPEDIMHIGKYKYERIGIVIRAEPLYIRWLLSVSQTFRLGPRALKLLEEQLGEEIIDYKPENDFTYDGTGALRQD